ncbi:MAG: hypothetical protein KAJ39_09405 [Gammaproteobacteria bacterium]|nr:hypothetical protein [Gammaproteobacteria bacterium]
MAKDGSKSYVPPPSAGSSGMKSSQSQENERLNRERKIKEAQERISKEGSDYKGPTAEQMVARTLAGSTSTKDHRAEARAVMRVTPQVESGEIPSELVAQRTQPGFMDGKDVVMRAHVPPTIEKRKDEVVVEKDKSIPFGSSVVLSELGYTPTPSDRSKSIDPYYLRPKVYNLSDYIDSFKQSDEYIGEHIPTLSEISDKGREFREHHPFIADVSYSLLSAAAGVVKLPSESEMLKGIQFYGSHQTTELDKPTTLVSEIHGRQPTILIHGKTPTGYNQSIKETQIPALTTIYTEHMKGAGEILTDFYSDFEKRPVESVTKDIAIPVLIGYGAGAIYGASSYLLKSALLKGAQAIGAKSLFGSGLTTLSKVIDPAVAVGMVGEIYKGVGEPETPKERMMYLKDTALSFMGAGSGYHSSMRFISNLKTVGMQKIPLEKITEPKVIRGEQFLPRLEKGETFTQFTGRFEKQMLPSEIGIYGARGWRGMTTRSRGLETDKTTGLTKIVKDMRHESDLAGQYFSPSSLSPHFVGLGKVGTGKYKKKDSTRFDLWGAIFGRDATIDPTILRTTGKGVERPPSSVVKTLESMQRFISKDAKDGVFYPSRDVELTWLRMSEGKKWERGKWESRGIREESEAVLPAGTMLKTTGKEYYTSIKGINVPITEYKAIGAGSKTKGTTKATDVYDTQRYYSSERKGLITPSQIIAKTPPSQYKPPPPSQYKLPPPPSKYKLPPPPSQYKPPPPSQYKPPTTSKYRPPTTSKYRPPPPSKYKPPPPSKYKPPPPSKYRPPPPSEYKPPPSQYRPPPPSRYKPPYKPSEYIYVKYMGAKKRKDKKRDKKRKGKIDSEWFIVNPIAPVLTQTRGKEKHISAVGAIKWKQKKK